MPKKKAPQSEVSTTVPKEKKPNPATRKRFGGPLPGSGRPPKPIDVDMVYKLAQTLLPVASIATILGCHKDTLYERFPDVLQMGREKRKSSLSQVMWDKALVDKDTKMMIWLSKQHLGYREQPLDADEKVTINVYINENPV